MEWFAPNENGVHLILGDLQGLSVSALSPPKQSVLAQSGKGSDLIFIPGPIEAIARRAILWIMEDKMSVVLLREISPTYLLLIVRFRVTGGFSGKGIP